MAENDAKAVLRVGHKWAGKFQIPIGWQHVTKTAAPVVFIGGVANQMRPKDWIGQRYGKLSSSTKQAPAVTVCIGKSTAQPLLLYFSLAQRGMAPVFEKMPTAERVRAAKQKTGRVVGHLIYLIALHENNAIVAFSNTLAAQIPTSYAANTFDLFRKGMYHLEIVRLCALWDRPWPDLSRESIPTVVELIADPKVIDALVEEARGAWTNSMPWADAPEDPKTDAAVQEALAFLNEKETEAKAAEARDELNQCVARGRNMEKSEILKGARNLRDKHLAHSLSETSLEKKGTVAPMRHGDERSLILDTIKLVEALHLWVNGTGFNFDQSRKFARQSAEALWKHCTFNIEP